MHRLRIFLAGLLAIAVPAVASAHFPFLHLKPAENGPPELHVYFSESAVPDDPALLDRLLGAEVWQLSKDGEPTPLTLKKGEASLTASPTSAGPAAFGFIKDYGVISRGGQPFLLQYYAKTFSGHEAWKTSTAKSLKLDIVPELKSDELTLTVLWEGKPLPNAEVVVEGGIEFIEGKADEAGRFTCKVPDPALYSIRAKHVEAKPGERDGKRFDDARHYSTLVLDLK